MIEPGGVNGIHDAGEDQLSVDAIQGPKQEGDVHAQRQSKRRKDVVSNSSDDRREFWVDFICSDEVVDEGDHVVTCVDDCIPERQINQFS